MSPGWRAWAMWGLPTGLFLIAFLHRVAPGVIAKDLMAAFDLPGARLGLLSATYFYAYAGLMIPAGLLIDAWGARRIVTGGGLVMGAGTLLMALAPGEGSLLAGRVLVGVGAATTFVAALKVAASWFPATYFGTVSALTATAGVLGSLLGTAPLAWLAGRAGWRGALALVGALTLLGAGLCAWLGRDQPPGAARAVAGAAPFGAVLAGLGQVLRNPHTWPPFLAFLFLVAPNQNLLLWTVPYLRDVYGLSATDAALAATATSLALLIAGPLTGYLSDRVLRRRRLPYTLLTAALLVAWLVFVLTLGRLPLAGLYALFFAMGLVGGAFVLTWPLGREVNPPALAGVAVATVNLGGFLGVALTQGPLGAVLDAGWRGRTAGGARVYPVEAYREAFALCAGLVLLAGLASLALRETRGQNVWRPREGPREPPGTPLVS